MDSTTQSRVGLTLTAIPRAHGFGQNLDRISELPPVRPFREPHNARLSPPPRYGFREEGAAPNREVVHAPNYSRPSALAAHVVPEIADRVTLARLART